MYNPFTKLSSSRQRLLITTVLTVLIVLIVGAIAVPTGRAILQRHQEIQSSLELIEKQYQEAQKSKRTLRELSSVLERITPFTTAFLTKENERTFITDMENLATTNNVKQIFSIELSNTPSTGIRGQTYTINVQAQGTFTQLMSYLHAIQQQPITIAINTVNLSATIPGRRNSDIVNVSDPIISLQFSGTVYAVQK